MGAHRLHPAHISNLLACIRAWTIGSLYRMVYIRIVDNTTNSYSSMNNISDCFSFIFSCKKNMNVIVVMWYGYNFLRNCSVAVGGLFAPSPPMPYAARSLLVSFQVKLKKLKNLN